MVRDNVGSASGRPAKACAFFCMAEQPGTTFEDLQNSGAFEGIDCEPAAGLSTVLDAEFRCIVKNLTVREHRAGRVLKGRQIYGAILQRYKVTDVDDAMRDFERLQRIRMRDDDLQRFIEDWGNLLSECRCPPDTKILES
eukprot:2454317-Pyramimonas_sp.AAC.1